MQRKAPTVEAVKDISLNIYEGQITAILGRNGAGKSTLFNMLTGLVTPTSGSSTVYGYNLRFNSTPNISWKTLKSTLTLHFIFCCSNPHDLAKVRKMTGVCLQYDLHFSQLTVEEHLEFYGTLRVQSSILFPSPIVFRFSISLNYVQMSFRV